MCPKPLEGGGKKASKGGREVVKAENLAVEQSARLKSACLSPPINHD